MHQRLGRNLGRYHGESILIWEVLREIDQIAAAAGWSRETFYAEADFSLGAYHRAGEKAGLRLYLSTGIHGDEPAGPLAARELFRRGMLPQELDITIVPCLNPRGFELNTRENELLMDLNRDYRQTRSSIVAAHKNWLLRQRPFELGILVHEDWEANGFYVYELNPEGRPSLAERMVEAVSKMGPIESSGTVDNWKCVNGIIRPQVSPEERPDWPEAIWLISNCTKQNYTIETPSDFPLEFRVEMHLAALRAALAALAGRE